MKDSIINIPGYKVNEYKLVIVPHQDLAKKVIALQKDFNENFKVSFKSIFIPQLTLVTFKQIQAYEERIINRLAIVGMGFHPLKIELSNFGSIPSHTIFINVATQLQVSELVRKIRREAQKLMKLDAENKPHFIIDPHITIGTKLKPWQYEQAWLEYCHRHFTGRFIASKMILLRKKEGEYKFIPIQNFEFQNLPVETRQGELF